MPVRTKQPKHCVSRIQNLPWDGYQNADENRSGPLKNFCYMSFHPRVYLRFSPEQSVPEDLRYNRAHSLTLSVSLRRSYGVLPAHILTLTWPEVRHIMPCMATLAFDTHKAVKALKEAGFEDAQAEAVVATVGDAMTGTVATKTDLQAIELRISEKFEALYKHLWFLAAGIVGLTVALVKLIP